MSFFSHPPLSFFFNLAQLFLLGVIAGRCGGALLSFIDARKITAAERSLFSTAFGLTLLALGTLSLGLLGRLNFTSVAGFICFMLVVPLFYKKNIFTLPKLPRAVLSRRAGYTLLVFSALAAVALHASAPPTANDALAYHLAHPKEFIEHRSVGYIPYSRESLWPYQTEMLYTVGLLLGGATLAQLMHWGFFLLTLAALSAFCRRFYSERVARFACLAFLFTPVAFTEASQAYVELALAFFILLALYAFLLPHAVLRRSEAALLSGVCCGAALGSKYLAIGAAAALFLFWIIDSRHSVRPPLMFALAVLGVGAVWYVRSWVILGNPIYPFFPRLFHSGYEFGIDQVGMGGDLLSLFKLPWNLTMHPDGFGGELLGPVFLLFLPLLFFHGRKVRKEDIYSVLLSCAVVLFIFLQAQQARFFIVVLPFLSMGAAVALDWAVQRGKALKMTAVAVFSAAILLNAAVMIHRMSDAWAVVAGLETPEQYLSGKERSFRGYRYLNQHVKTGEKAFNHCEQRRFYNELPDLVIDGEALRMQLERRNLSIRDYLSAEKFDYIWVESRSDARILDFIRHSRYEKAYSYEISSYGVPFRYDIYRRPA